MSEHEEMPPYFETVLDTIGHTPTVRLQRLPGPQSAMVLAKLESRNPAGSVKDRIALSMIEAAERDGRLQPGDTVVEPTSGNTGIGLAMVCAVKGYRLILTMPDDMSVERQRLLKWLGAELHLTPAIEGMTGAVFAAEEMVREHGYFMPRQFENPANPEIHMRTTAREVLRACEGRLDAFVCGVGTGGTLTGVARVLKQELPTVKVVAVEPAGSPVLSGGRPGRHSIQGLGAGFVPGVLDRSAIDRVMTVTDVSALEMSRRLAREEGILAGWSSGAVVWAALRLARELGPAGKVFCVLPDNGDRYASMMKD